MRKCDKSEDTACSQSHIVTFPLPVMITPSVFAIKKLMFVMFSYFCSLKYVASLTPLDGSEEEERRLFSQTTWDYRLRRRTKIFVNALKETGNESSKHGRFHIRANGCQQNFFPWTVRVKCYISTALLQRSGKKMDYWKVRWSRK